MPKQGRRILVRPTGDPAVDPVVKATQRAVNEALGQLDKRAHLDNGGDLAYAGGHRMLLGPLYVNNVGTELGGDYINNVGDSTSAIAWVPSRNGSLVSLSLWANAALTAGQFRVDVYNGSDLVHKGQWLNTSSQGDNRNYEVIKKDKVRVAAGDEIFFKFTTSGVTPTTVDVYLWVEVEM